MEKGRAMKELVRVVIERWSNAWRDVLASSVAGAIAWVIAQKLFGHPYPIFAAIVALICLAPGLPSHARQAMGLLVGVGTGIPIGELALTLGGDLPVLSGSVATFIAMMFASSFGLGPVVPIQAGVSVILVLVMGPMTAGYVRLLDSCVGIVVALLFSQLLVTPDPVGMVKQAAAKLLRELAAAFSASADALERADTAAAQAAMDKFSAAHDSLNALASSLDWACRAARWSLRGRFSAAEIRELAARYDRRSIRIYASGLLFGEALANALRKNESPAPPRLKERVREAARLCEALSSGKVPESLVPPVDIPLENLPQSWRICVDRLAAAEDALRAFASTGPEDQS
ncbi:FUSC family protein [Pseudaminobacter soli (ex Li et al. 2025)]|uniref:FUSC family protein n=1 Tax=Pseudaminobacter soli (ex Li et al. 2025) TaxID=1295366 RepID=UPI0015E69BFF|nr:FUSC family protein [Mesorhizobium soli]